MLGFGVIVSFNFIAAMTLIPIFLTFWAQRLIKAGATLTSHAQVKPPSSRRRAASRPTADQREQSER